MPEVATTFDEPWLAKVKEAVDTAVSIAWEGCHKIYIMSDEQSNADMIDLEYEPIRVCDKQEAVDQLFEWWECSCSLRFIQRIEGEQGSNENYYNVIGQFDYNEYEGDE